MGFLSFIVLCVIAFLLWRISDQMPDVLFRLERSTKLLPRCVVRASVLIAIDQFKWIGVFSWACR